MISKVRGTEDLLDLKLHNFVLDLLKKHVLLYNFNEIQTPVLEHTNLFIRSLGQQTDVVSKEMFIIKSHNEEKEESICLRPEATAPTMRAFLENHIAEKPWKVFSFGPMFRYERPQKGRWRQFSQFNIEVINSSSILQDAHFIKMLDVFFGEKLKLDNYVIKLNFLGNLEDRKKYKQKLYEYLDKFETQICKTCQERKEKNILRIFDCKSEECQKIYLDAPKITDNLSPETKKEWEYLVNCLNILSVSHVVDHKLVRGLDYYNKTVFEFSSKDLGAQDAFCGGGRYALGKELEAKEEYPSIGVAIGIGRLLILTEKYQNLLTIPQESALHIILPMSEKQHELALLLAYELQSNNLCTDILLEGASMTNMMKRTNKMGAKFVLILGDEEQTNGTVSIKNMQTGDSKTIKQSEAATILK